MELTHEQRFIVDSIATHKIVEADAGTSKTTTLTHSVVADINRGLDPSKMLVITFSRTAADTLRQRLESMHPEAKCIRIATIHGWCYSLLQSWNSGRKIKILNESLRKKYFFQALQKFDSSYDNKDVDQILAAYTLTVNQQKKSGMLALISLPVQQVKQVFEDYIKYKNENGFSDFDDLQIGVDRLLDRSPRALASIRADHRVVYLDEAQDTSTLQWSIINRLKPSRLFVVGDQKQSIYGWRGSVVAFRSQVPGSECFQLHENFRSSKEIVAVANAVFPTGVKTNNPSGPKPLIFGTQDPVESAREVISLANRLSRHGTVGILGRSWEPIRLLGGSLYLATGGSGIREENNLINPSITKFWQLFNWAFFKSDDTWADCISVLGVPPSVKPQDILVRPDELFSPFDGLNLREDQVKALVFLRDFKKDSSNPVSPFIRLYHDFYREYFDDDEYLASTCQVLSELPLSSNRLRFDRSQCRSENIFINTLHGVKGEQFDSVIFIGLNDGIIPSAITSDREEERRLFYVGVTRPKRNLFLAFSAKDNNGNDLTRSPFLDEIDVPELVSCMGVEDYFKHESFDNTCERDTYMDDGAGII